MHTFSITETVTSAWNTVRKNLSFFVALSLLVIGISFLSEIISPFQPSAGTEVALPDLLLYVLLLGVNMVLGIWVLRVGLDAADAKRLSFTNMVPAWEVVWKFILSNAIVSLIIIVPAMILVYLIGIFVLGTIFGGVMFYDPSNPAGIYYLVLLMLFLISVLVFVGIRLMFVTYFVVDQKFGPIQSIKRSWLITRGVVWKLIGLTFVLSLINFVGMLALFIGLLVTVPISVVAMAVVYRALTDSGDSVPTPSGEVVESVPIPEIGNE